MNHQHKKYDQVEDLLLDEISSMAEEINKRGTNLEDVLVLSKKIGKYSQAVENLRTLHNVK